MVEFYALRIDDVKILPEGKINKMLEPMKLISALYSVKDKSWHWARPKQQFIGELYLYTMNNKPKKKK